MTSLLYLSNSIYSQVIHSAGSGQKSLKGSWVRPERILDFTIITHLKRVDTH